MKAISQPPVAAREQRGHAGAPLARSRSRELHCWSLRSLSCLCLTSFRRSARRLRGRVPREPKSSLSSLLASSRKSFERSVMLTQDSSQRSPPSESLPSHSTSTSKGRPRRPSCRRPPPSIVRFLTGEDRPHGDTLSNVPSGALHFLSASFLALWIPPRFDLNTYNLAHIHCNLPT